MKIVDSLHQKVSFEGDELNPFWSADGRRLLFQTDREGNWDIYEYDLESDTVFPVIFSQANEQNPVWIQDEKIIVFDSDETGEERLYQFEPESGKKKLLFEREIRARQASFSKSELLVFFSGYDPVRENWDIYSYEFFYQNLNHLIESPEANHSPKFAKDGDHALYIDTSFDYPFSTLKVISWYGEPYTGFSEFRIMDPSWGAFGLKIYFVSDKDDMTGDIYSMWQDGSHLERITAEKREIRTPAISPDGSKLAFSLKTDKGFDIFIVSTEDY